MGSVASDVGDFVSDTVSSVGDIGQSVIDAGSDVINNVGSGISDAAQGVSDAFAQIDPGPAIGEAGAAVDKVVNDVIPGGWAMVGAIALTVASMGTVDLEPEVLAAAAAEEAAAGGVAATESIAATQVAAYDAGWSAAEAGVYAGGEGAASTAATNAAANAAVQAAATGALKGAAIGAAKSALTGGDIIQGALNGAATGAIGGGIGNYASGLTAGTDLADYAKTIGAVAGGTAGGATGAALNGRDPLTGALIGGISGGTSSVASNLLPTDINPAITSAGLGAAKAAIMGGDPLTAALTSAGGSLINQGVGAGYDAVKSGLNSLDTTSPPPTQTADITQDPNYKAAIEAGFNPDEAKALAQGASDPTLPSYAPVASNGSVSVTSAGDFQAPTTPLVTPAANAPEAFPDKTSPTGYSNNNGDPVNADGSTYTSPLDATLAATIDGVDKNTSSGGLPTTTATPSMPEGYSSQPPNLDRPMAYTADMPPEGTTWAYNNNTGERIAVPVNGGGNGSSPIDAGNSIPIPGDGTGNGSGNGNGPIAGTGDGSGSGGSGDGNNNAPAIEPPPPVLPPTAGGGGSGSSGSGGGGGSSGIGSGLGSILGGSALAAQQLNNQATNPGLMNLTPGLTKPMDYDLAGLSHYATGGSTTSKNSSLFDDKGAYNYGNLSDTPLTAMLTKHNVSYNLAGLPTKADGGLVQHMANGGQFGFSGNFGITDKTAPSHESFQPPQFYSEGGASIKNRYVKGAGDGTSDSIPAMLANGEFVIPADVVSNLGNGSNDSGAKILDEFLRVIREHKTKHDARRLPPDSKGPLSYLTDAKRKARK